MNKSRWDEIRQTFSQEVTNKLTGRSSQLVIEAMQAYKKEMLEGGGKQTSEKEPVGAEGGHVSAHMRSRLW